MRGLGGLFRNGGWGGMKGRSGQAERERRSGRAGLRNSNRRNRLSGFRDFLRKLFAFLKFGGPPSPRPPAHNIRWFC